VSKVYTKYVNAISCSVDPRTKLESGYPPTPSLLYIVHSGGQNRHLSPSDKLGQGYLLQSSIYYKYRSVLMPNWRLVQQKNQRIRGATLGDFSPKCIFKDFEDL
jgi:hypothetical protein